MLYIGIKIEALEDKGCWKGAPFDVGGKFYFEMPTHPI
jgi:hypothetical protein